MINKPLPLSLLIYIATVLLSCSTNNTAKKTKQANNTVQELRGYVDSLVRKTNFNGNLLVATDDGKIYKNHFGLSDFSTGEKLNDSRHISIMLYLQTVYRSRNYTFRKKTAIAL